MQKREKRNISSIMPLFVLMIFAFCLVDVLLCGATIYQKTTQRDQAAFQERTVCQYLTTKLHQYDSVNSVKLEGFTENEEGNVLVMEETVDDAVYQTRIYAHDGYLCELFCAQTEPFQPDAGEKVLPVGTVRFSFEEEKRLLQAEILGEGGEEERVVVHLRSGEVGLP